MKWAKKTDCLKFRHEEVFAHFLGKHLFVSIFLRKPLGIAIYFFIRAIKSSDIA